MALLKVAGFACMIAAGVWALIVAHVQGFLWEMLVSLFASRDHRRRADRSIFSEHWADVSGPFWLMVFGVALLLVATRT
jgi:hypothetical protein